jgi:sulfur-oxidizing protein SoxY
MKLRRRTFINYAGTALAFAVTSVCWPLRALAQSLRPEAAFAAKALDAAFAALGGTPEASDAISFSTPEIAENGAVVPISVLSNIAGTEMIAILVEKNPSPLAATFYFPEGTEAFVQARVKVSQTCKLHALVKAGGKLYSTSRETKVTLGGCGG